MSILFITYLLLFTYNPIVLLLINSLGMNDMASYLTCAACGGRKKVAPLGGILKDCAICNGVGYIEQLGHNLVKPARLDIAPPLALSAAADIVCGVVSTGLSDDERALLDDIQAKQKKRGRPFSKRVAA
jgi:hypothetical protein